MTGGTSQHDKIHFAIEHLLASPDGWRPLVRAMIARWPDAPATELIFAIVSAASEIEAIFADGSPAREGAGHGWRIAALLGVDIYAMQSIGLPHRVASDFTRYWSVDPYFRDL